jgi:hypothetical protein
MSSSSFGDYGLSNDDLYRLGAHWRQAERLEQVTMTVCEAIHEMTMPPVMLEEIQPWLILLSSMAEQSRKIRESVAPIIGPESVFNQSQQTGEDNGI